MMFSFGEMSLDVEKLAGLNVYERTGLVKELKNNVTNCKRRLYVWDLYI